MRRLWLSVVIALAAMSISTVALGQSSGKKGKDTSKDTSSATPKERKDPKGVTGISPYMELIAKGHAAYQAKDHAGAMSAYDEASKKEPSKALAYYLMGQLHLLEKRIEEAEKAWQTALRYAEKEPLMRAKVLLVLADLKERQTKLDEAAKGWKDYETFVASSPIAKGYPTTAAQRQTAITTHNELAEKYGKVRDRIKQREAETASAAAAPAK